MTPLLAAYADAIIIEAAKLAAFALGIAVLFGIPYWLIRRRKAAREDAARKLWLEERRAKRETAKPEPSDR